MTFEPLFAAPLPVQIHFFTVAAAFLLGAWQISASAKGSFLHRRLGYLYLALMSATSVAALFIHEVNPSGPFGFSWIHLFVPLTLFGITGALHGSAHAQYRQT